MPKAPEHQYILNRLETELPAYLQYHTLAHTLDVCACAERIATAEHVDPDGMRLLQTAAAFHDSGYLYQAAGHEARSCVIVRETLPGFGYTDAEIDTICGLILATRVPQRPETKLQQIICDADLDYLGRKDFPELSEKLYAEMLHNHVVKDHQSWNELQVRFLNEHRYFTHTSKTLRDAAKAKHLLQILDTL